MAPLAPQLIELPLLLAVFGFSAAMMGLGGADLSDFHVIRKKMLQSPLGGFVYLEDNGILTVDLLMLIAGAITFFVSIVAIVACARQWGKRRGEYSGKGTGLWLILGLIFLLLSGLWAGTAAAYTAFTVKYTWSFSRGPSYSEPFNTTQQAYMRSISQMLTSGEPGSLNVLSAPGATGIDSSYLGQWGLVRTLDQANAIPQRYLDYSTKWKAATAVSWFMLGSTFLVMVVHFALPFVWKACGLLREPRREKNQYNEM
ncbi:unnamed protein product [Parajaminaea phylloscopi]